MPGPGVVPDGVRSLHVDVIVERYLALYRRLSPEVRR
jgi:hypothetical protein